MANQKLTQQTEDTSPTLEDVTYSVNDPAGTPASRKVTWANVRKLFRAITAKSANYPLTSADYIVDVTTGVGGVTITLPTFASAPADAVYIITKADSGAGALTVSGNGTNINGAASKATSTQYAGFMIFKGAAEWRSVALTGA